MYVLGCIFYFIAQKEHKIVVWKSYRFFLFPVIVHYCFPWHPVSLILYLPIHSMCWCCYDSAGQDAEAYGPTGEKEGARGTKVQKCLKVAETLLCRACNRIGEASIAEMFWSVFNSCQCLLQSPSLTKNACVLDCTCTQGKIEDGQGRKRRCRNDRGEVILVLNENVSIRC